MTVRQRLARAAAIAGAVLAMAGTARAQRPDASWRTIATPHFRVHFTAQTEQVARHAGASAEWAWSQLARELVPPRGPIDLVVSDDADFSNGYTTSFPTNRIVIYTQPPVDDPFLRDYDDWIALVITHELTHAFHLDRSRGLWRGLQYVFGRNPYLFPANYEPRWVAEGLAVYYESRITGAGRVVASGHRAVARAAALGGRSPRLGDLRVARRSFPGGEGVYVFGSLIFDELARTRGAASVPRYIEYTSAYLLPFQLNRTARAAFGESFTAALAAVRDTALSGVDGSRPPLGDWRALTTGFDELRAPRRAGEGIVFGASTGRETPGAYLVDSTGGLRRLGRRTTATVNQPLADGDILTAQLELSSPYEIRSDLYVQHGRRLRRITHEARLTAPDARADGEIVAVQAVPGTTILVRVSRDGSAIRPLTRAAADTQWAQPRWSPDGRAIAAVRVFRGRRSQIVVLDSTGAELAVVADERGSLSAAPAWSADGRTILFTSDRSGIAQVYAAPVPLAPGGGGSIAPLTASTTAVAEPLELSPPRDSALAAPRRVAVVALEARGWALGSGVTVAGASESGWAARGDSTSRIPYVLHDDSPAHGYEALRQLVPRYWMPIIYADNSITVLGASTSASDVVGRHSYSASAEAATRWGEYGGSFSYQWAGLRMPLLALGISQGWDGAGTVVDQGTGAPLGSVRRRTRTASAGFVWSRPRTRHALAASAFGGVESRDYATHPEWLREAFTSDFLRRTHRRPFVFGGLAASNVQHPTRSISAEDGASAFVSGQRLWDAVEASGGHSRVVGSLAAYRSVPLPGYAHHVLAARAVGGWSDSKDPGEFTVGGVSGDAIAVGGTDIGGSSDFPIRGYLSGAMVGTRALAGSLEYRAPLLIPARGATILFLDRSSVSLFADAATAWCGAGVVASACASRASRATPLASIGAELVLDLAIFYDAPLTVRAGAAKPVGAQRTNGAARSAVYVAAGRAF